LTFGDTNKLNFATVSREYRISEDQLIDEFELWSSTVDDKQVWKLVISQWIIRLKFETINEDMSQAFEIITSDLFGDFVLSIELLVWHTSYETTQSPTRPSS
jgi:hypothetical protein